MSEVDDPELSQIGTQKEIRASQTDRSRKTKKKHKTTSWPRSRMWSPEWSYPRVPRSQIKREEAKAEGLVRFWDYPVTKLQPVKHKLRNHLSNHWLN